jgi:hypothetical protein
MPPLRGKAARRAHHREGAYSHEQVVDADVDLGKLSDLLLRLFGNPNCYYVDVRRQTTLYAPRLLEQASLHPPKATGILSGWCC